MKKDLCLDNARKLIDFIYASPTPFHAVMNAKELLVSRGFTGLDEGDAWNIQPGGKYYITKNGSALIAFIIGNGPPAEHGFRIAAAHVDAPGIRIKPNPEMLAEDAYIKINTEIYGSPILHTWLDRPLSLAGRVILKGGGPFTPECRLVNVARPLFVIPDLAVHMNQKLATGIELGKQLDMIPLAGIAGGDCTMKNFLVKLLADEMNVGPDSILDHELYLYEYDRGTTAGINDEFISSSRLDDLEAVYAILSPFSEAKPSAQTLMLAFFDNEEVGSSTKQGADSPVLAGVIERIIACMGRGREDFFRAMGRSFLISADAAHGVHPNNGDKSDPTNRPIVNKGPVIKTSVNQRYTSDAGSSGIFEGICRSAGVPVQRFVNRSDERGGTTIGPISATHLPISAVDVGVPVLGMHSIREMGGTADHTWFIDALKAYYAL